MAGQTQVNRVNGYSDQHAKRLAAAESSSPNDTRGVRRLLADLTELGELQIQLFSADVRETQKRITGPILYTIIGIALVLGSIPELLLTAADILENQLGWQAWTAQLASGGVAVVCGLVALAIAYRKFTMITEPIERSTGELAKTLAALRQMLSNSDSKPTP